MRPQPVGSLFAAAQDAVSQPEGPHAGQCGDGNPEQRGGPGGWQHATEGTEAEPQSGRQQQRALAPGCPADVTP